MIESGYLRLVYQLSNIALRELGLLRVRLYILPDCDKSHHQKTP